MRETLLAKIAVTLSCAAVVALFGFLWRANASMLTREEAIQLVQVYCPYDRERIALDQRLRYLETQDGVLIGVLKDNTQAIQDLRVQLERILVVPPAHVLKQLEQLEQLVTEKLR